MYRYDIGFQLINRYDNKLKLNLQLPGRPLLLELLSLDFSEGFSKIFERFVQL